MATGLIGALRVTLGLDASEFIAGSSKAKAELRGFQREFKSVGTKFQDIGKDLTKWVTLPIAAAGAATVKLAGDFQSSMNQVGINANATAQQLAAMREQALNIGKDTSKSASEAADAMNMLAKTGVSAQDILGGAARAAVNLAVATGSQLDPATAAISDTMNQFGKTAKELPGVIDQITGAVNQSKFDFADFQLGMGQAGAVASAAGVSFEDFTGTLAGTASMFASGSDAGTSLKTFLNFLVPKSKEAAAAIEELGLKFYDSNGQLKSMADIAQQLQDKLGPLSEEARNKALHDIFGTDGMRTAIGLMKLGAQGLDEVKAKIADTSAVDQANIRMAGFNGQMEQLKGALETLAIRIADSGLLEWATNLVKGLSDIVDSLSKTNPEMLKWGVIIAGIAASFGPFMLVFGGFIRAMGVALPLLMKLGPAFRILSTAIGYLVPVVTAVSRVLIGGLLANPVLLGAAALIGGVYLAFKNWDKIKPIVDNMVHGVAEAMRGKFKQAMDNARENIKIIKQDFYNLYDAVVGHSYIPDMVDGIGQHMRRLDKEMVAPTKAATSATSQAFEQLRSEVASILDRLYPDQALTNQFHADLDTLEKGMKKLGFSTDEAADARMRLWEEYQKRISGEDITQVSQDLLNSARVQTTGDAPDLKDWLQQHKDGVGEIAKITKDKTLEMTQAWANLAVNAIGSMRGMVQSFKSGDILGGIERLLDLVINVIGAVRGLNQQRSSAAAGNAGNTPTGYATGGSFKVGGSGGVDSQLVRFRATPGEHVSVRRGDQMDRKRGPAPVFDLRGAVMTQDLLDQMNAMSQDAAQRGTVGGAALAGRQNQRARRSALA